jgi:hypothetical protein
MKSKKVFARPARTGFIEWSFLARLFPTHRQHIERIKGDQEKLRLLASRLIDISRLRASRGSSAFAGRGSRGSRPS